MAYLTPTAPTTIPVGAVAPLGFSTRVVVDATADAVRDSLGIDAEMFAWRFGAVCTGMRWGVMRHRVRESHRYSVILSGGTVALEHKEPRPYEREDAWRDTAMQRLQGLLWDDEEPQLDEDQPSRVITEWSRRSRARMVRALAEIDHDTWTAHGTLGMVTLTLPGNWQAVAPTGADFKKKFRRLQWRWLREVKQPWQVCWKLEFQRRGAPHLHLMMKCPAKVGSETFETWLSRTWAQVCNADNAQCVSCAESCSCAEPDTEYRRHLAAGTNVDFAANTTDPKRIAVYFLKHSSKTQDSKEYQHIVPAAWRSPGKGPGRFWGISGVKRHTQRVEISRDMWIQMRRILRGVHRGNRARTALARRSAGVAQMGETWRKATLLDLSAYGAGRDRILASSTGGGWILSNDAPALLHLIAQWLANSQPRDVGP